MRKNPAAKTSSKLVEADHEVDLAAAVREISAAMTKLTASGLNRHAVVVLLRDMTGVGKSKIEEVLNGLKDLEKRYTR